MIHDQSLTKIPIKLDHVSTSTRPIATAWNAGEMYFQRGFECAYILNLKHCNNYSDSFWSTLWCFNVWWWWFEHWYKDVSATTGQDVPIVVVDQGALGVSKQKLYWLPLGAHFWRSRTELIPIVSSLFLKHEIFAPNHLAKRTCSLLKHCLRFASERNYCR
jgi:hypothetical protein